VKSASFFHFVSPSLCLYVSRPYNSRMIAAITGRLKSVSDNAILLDVGPIVYEILVPASDMTELHASLGEELTFYTMFYLQGDGSGSSLEPRLIGFLRRDDKRFFEKFITVKGIGPKTALRALTVPVGEIAAAIEGKDARFLVGLDGIGKRTAELVIAELSGKVDQFVTTIAARTRPAAPSRRNSVEEDAIAAMVALGERRLDAEHLLDRVKSADPSLSATNDFVREMLRFRTVRA
jgi:holliday junction DNA helicase RuvA